jgi:diadenosine tetraphosphatase ApaH/serine/threonine PP2A family protein phosphatase
MRLAIASDIHSNLEALQVVLADIDCSTVDDMVSLGDNIGYGPNPEEVLELLRLRGVLSIMGNHELGIVDPSCLPWFNAVARDSLEINQGLLSDESINSLGTLPSHRIVDDCLCVHGFPPDSIITYLFEVSDAQIASVLLAMAQELCFVGHTHVLALISWDGKRVHHQRLSQGTVHLPPGYKYLVNAGSVGQPRDGDNRTKYLIWDSGERLLEVRCLEYDIARTADLILRLGLPGINAYRLW